MAACWTASFRYLPHYPHDILSKGVAVCQKYEIEEVQSMIRAAIKAGTFPAPVKVKAEGFSAYTIASGLELVPEAEDAARLMLGQR